MAKVIRYKANTKRKLGFKRVLTDLQESQGQLNLFQVQNQKESKLKSLRHLDPFQQALQLDEKNIDLSEKLYLESIEQNISVSDAYCNLGILQAQKGNTAKAIDCFTNALAKDPRHVEAHYNLANMYFDAGNYALAGTHYKIASEMDITFPEIYFNLALASLALDDKKEAIAALKTYLLFSFTEEPKEASYLLALLES
jgi:tetratricopeptide (TPR) repeat protein